MTEEDALARLSALLQARHGVPARAIRPEARIMRDLGVDGDDALDLIEAAEAAFGVKSPFAFAAHFHEEGAFSFRKVRELTLGEFARGFAAGAATE